MLRLELKLAMDLEAEFMANSMAIVVGCKDYWEPPTVANLSSCFLIILPDLAKTT